MIATAVFAAGCFWGVEDTFLSVKGVIATRVGYTGGHTEHPGYKEVCTGNTGHAEAVEVTFDDQLVSYAELLQIFWQCHDPTQINRQGPDVGEQYRSAIFCTSEQQLLEAMAAKEVLDRVGIRGRSLATRIELAGVFWQAEEYHQKYHQKNGGGCGF